jgi:hypothetical protein
MYPIEYTGVDEHYLFGGMDAGASAATGPLRGVDLRRFDQRIPQLYLAALAAHAWARQPVSCPFDGGLGDAVPELAGDRRRGYTPDTPDGRLCIGRV